MKSEGGYQTTVPRPFNLSNNEQFGQIRKNKQRDLKEKEMSECTFKPLTNEARNRDIVHQLMNSDTYEEEPYYYNENEQ